MAKRLRHRFANPRLMQLLQLPRLWRASVGSLSVISTPLSTNHYRLRNHAPSKHTVSPPDQLFTLHQRAASCTSQPVSASIPVATALAQRHQTRCTSAGPRMATCSLTTRLPSSAGSLSGARPEQRSSLHAATLVTAPRRRRSSVAPVRAEAFVASTPLVLQLAPAAAWTLVGVMALRVFMGEQQVRWAGRAHEKNWCDLAGACRRRTPYVPLHPPYVCKPVSRSQAGHVQLLQRNIFFYHIAGPC